MDMYIYVGLSPLWLQIRESQWSKMPEGTSFTELPVHVNTNNIKAAKPHIRMMKARI